MWGLEWGMRSRIKWLANANVIPKKGLLTFVAIAAPTNTCGSSTIILLSLYAILIHAVMSTFIVLFQSVLIALGVLIAFFVMWKFLKEDYPENQIFTLSFIIFSGVVGSVIVMSSIYKQAIFWVAALSSFLLVVWQAKRYDMRFFEVLEFVVLALYLILMFVLGAFVLRGITIALSVEVGLFALVLIVYILVRRNFRHFLWYPSGKVGLASLLSLGLYGLGRALLATLSSSMLFLSSVFLDVALGISLSILCLITAYLRSGREECRDLKLWLLKRK